MLLELHSPLKGMDTDAFLSEANQVLHDYNPMLLQVELDLEYTKAEETLRQEPIPPTIWRHGDRAYSRDQVTSFAVTPEEDYILQTFLESGKAMETRDLTNKSGVTNVSRTIGALREKYGGVFADAIRTPADGKKGAGGYFIRVRNAGS